jgi:hypothetical protein
MEALKLAFETVIVGLFALPWLWVMIDLVNPGLFGSPAVRRLGALVPSELRATAIGLALFSTVYLLGSMITPVACEFLDDPDMLGEFLPTQQRIQAWVYKQMDARPQIADLIVPTDLALVAFRDPDPKSPEGEKVKRYRESVDGEFQHDESTLLLQGPQACERLNRLHEQLTVLRGASFSAFALSALCFFAWCARGKQPNTIAGRPSFWPRVRRWAGLIICLGTMIVAINGLGNDVRHTESGDIPIAELVFLVLSGFGLYVLIWGTRSRLQFHGPAFVFAFCFAALCYGGYGSVATSYDQAVFNSYLALPASVTGNGTHAVGESKIAANMGEGR